MKRIFSWVLTLSFLLALTVPAMAADDATGTTLRLEETNGTVTVKDAAGKDKSARGGMRLYSGYTIATGASSSAYISLDDTKAVKLDSSGKVEIKKSGKKLEVSLTSGQIYFNVTEPLKVDESLNIRTSTMVTGIRGSFGWVNLTQMGLMHGHVTLTCTNPETGEARVTEVYTGEKVSYEQATAAGGADSELAEIAFVKKEIVLEDVPATVVEEIAKDETLQAQLAEAAAEALAADETAKVIDVTELVESLPEKQAEEKALEEQAQETVEAAVAAQEEAIVAAAAEDTAGTTAGGTTTNYVDLSANTTPATGGGGGGDSGGDYTPSTTYYTVTMIVERASHCTVDYQSSYSVPAGGSFSFTVTREADYGDGGYYSYSIDSGGSGSMSITSTSGNTTTFTVSGITSNTVFHFESVSAYTFKVTDSTLLGDVSTALSKYGNVELNLVDVTNKEWTPADKTLSINADQFLSIRGGTLVLNSSEAASINVWGTMRINNGATLDMRRTDGSLSIQSNGSITNIGNMKISSLTVMNNASFYNVQSAAATFCGASSSDGDMYNIGSATIAIASTGSLSTTGSLYNESTIINEGSINNSGTITNTNGSIDNRVGATFTNNGTINN